MFKEIIKPVVTEALKAATTPAEKLAVVKRVQKEAYMNASDDVKQEVKDVFDGMALAKASLREKTTSVTGLKCSEWVSICTTASDGIARRMHWMVVHDPYGRT
jgi:hypothetical protein